MFNNLTINNSSGLYPGVSSTINNLTVNNNLTMNSGVVNLGGATVTLGSSATNTGTLSYSAGWFYGGNIVRWFPTSAITLGSNASLFPAGDAANYRPMYFGSTGLTASGGTVKVSHTSVAGSTTVSFPDGASTVSIRSNSYWTVSTANGISSTGTPFTVRTEGTGFGVVGNVSDLRLTLSASAAPGTAGVNAGTITNPQVNRTGFSVANLSHNFYWGSVNPGMTSLPVRLLSFTGGQQSGKALLHWTTGVEEYGMSFLVERSANGEDYVQIGKVAAAGSGSGYSYLYTDEYPAPGKNYYRLKLADPDGSGSYSWVVAVSFTANNGFTLFPNPSDGGAITARVPVSTGTLYSIDVFNDQGMRIGHAYSTSATLTILFSPRLPPGVYFARLTSGGNTTVRSFVVRR